MKELLEYRVKLIDRLEQAAREFCEACENQNPAVKLEGDWNAHQIASHTRDVDKLVYGARIEQTLKEDNPLFNNFDADGWMAEHYNQDEPLAAILAEFLNHTQVICAALRAMPQNGWSRLSQHETLGNELTLQLWVERDLAHIEEHLKTLRLE